MNCKKWAFYSSPLTPYSSRPSSVTARSYATRQSMLEGWGRWSGEGEAVNWGSGWKALRRNAVSLSSTHDSLLPTHSIEKGGVKEI